MKDLKKLVKMAIGILIIIVIFSFATMIMTKNQANTKITGELLKNKLENVSELTTTKYNYTNMGAFENTNTFYGWNVPFTTKKFIISYDGTINAGIDMKNIKVEVTNKKIEITLPEPKILSHTIHEDSIKVFNEQTSIFNPIKLEDYSTFATDQKSTMEDEAISKGFLKSVRENTKKSIEELLKFNKETSSYEIIFN